MESVRVIGALVILGASLLALVVLTALGQIPVEVTTPVLTAVMGAIVGYLFPSPLQHNCR